jgi:hypothetical protein
VVRLAVGAVVEHVLAWPSAAAAEGRKTADGGRGKVWRVGQQLLGLEVAEVADEGGLVAGAAATDADGRALRLDPVGVLINRLIRLLGSI